MYNKCKMDCILFLLAVLCCHRLEKKTRFSRAVVPCWSCGVWSWTRGTQQLYHIRFGDGIHGQQTSQLLEPPKEPFDLDSTSSKFQAQLTSLKKHLDQKWRMSHFPKIYKHLKKNQSFDRALLFLGGIVWRLAWYFLVFLRFVLVRHIPPQEGHEVCWRFTLSRNHNQRKLTTLTQLWHRDIISR